MHLTNRKRRTPLLLLVKSKLLIQKWEYSLRTPWSSKNIWAKSSIGSLIKQRSESARPGCWQQLSNGIAFTCLFLMIYLCMKTFPLTLMMREPIYSVWMGFMKLRLCATNYVSGETLGDSNHQLVPEI